MNKPLKPKLGRLIKNGLQIILIATLVWFVWNNLYNQWDQFREEALDVNWFYLGIALGGMVVGFLGVPLGSWVALNDLGHRRARYSIWRVYYISNVAKYLPGSIWGQIGRAYLYQRQGVPAATSAIAVLWEMLLMLVSGGVLSLLGVRVVGSYLSPAGVIGFLLLAVAASALFVMIFQLPDLRQQLARLPLPKSIKNLLLHANLWLTLPQALHIVLIYLVSWVTTGLAFAAVVRAFVPDFELVWTVEMIGLYMMAWCVGYVVFFAPGGIGVRDGLLVMGLLIYFDDPLPMMIAVAARLLWTVCEISLALVFGVLPDPTHSIPVAVEAGTTGSAKTGSDRVTP